MVLPDDTGGDDWLRRRPKWRRPLSNLTCSSSCPRRLPCAPHPVASLCAVFAMTMPKSFAELGLEQQQRHFGRLIYGPSRELARTANQKKSCRRRPIASVEQTYPLS